ESPVSIRSEMWHSRTHAQSICSSTERSEGRLPQSRKDPGSDVAGGLPSVILVNVSSTLNVFQVLARARRSSDVNRGLGSFRWTPKVQAARAAIPKFMKAPFRWQLLSI